MNEYNQVNVKLSPHNWISWNQTGVTLRINIKMCSGNNFPHELLLTTRQKTKLINAWDICNKSWWLFRYLYTLDCLLLTVTVLKLNTFLKKLKNLLGIKTWKQTNLEYNQTIQ